MSKNFKQFSKAIWEKYEVVEEENKPTNPELWARAKSMAKKKFDVYPSAYANGWASKWYKSKGGGWKSVSEDVEPEKKDEYDGEVDMAKNQLKRIISHAQHFHDMLTDKDQNLPEWVQSKVTKAEDYISSAHDYMMGEMQEATYTAFHIKHGKKTVQADSTYGAAKAAASHWNTGKKGTQGINVHLHTDKPQAYTEETMDEDYKQGQSAFKAGKKYSDNPHPKGSDAHLQWSKGHNQARANKLSEDTVTYTHKDTGAKMKSKFITDVAAKNFATQLRSQQHKNIEHHKEEADVPALLKKEGYYKDIATKKAEDERLAKQKKTNYPPHMNDLLKKARAYDKKNPIPKNEAVTKTIKPGQGYKMEEESIEESALTRVMSKLKDVETKKSFETGQSRIPTPDERRRQLSKRAQVVKEAAKKKKQKPESFEAEPELTSDVQIKGS